MSRPSATRAIRQRLQFGFSVDAVAAEFQVPREDVLEIRKKLKLEAAKRRRPKLTKEQVAERLERRRSYHRRYMQTRRMQAAGFTQSQIDLVLGMIE